MLKKLGWKSFGVLALFISFAAPGQTSKSLPGREPAAASSRLAGTDAQRAEELAKATEIALKADRWDEAMGKAEQLLVLRVRAQGPKHFETIDQEWRLRTLRQVASMTEEDRAAYRSAGTMNEQGEALFGQGKYAAGQQLFEKALEIRRRLLTDDHPDTVQSQSNLALSLAAQGKYALAQPLLEKVLEIERRLLTEDSPVTGQGYNNLAYIIFLQGKHAQAQPLYEKAIQIRRRLLGDDHPDTARAYSNLGSDLAAQGKYAEAETVHQKALEIRRRAFKDSHPDTARHPDTAQSYNNLAYVLHAQGKLAQAQSLFEKSLEILRRMLTDNHPATAKGHGSLARNLHAQGKYAGAQPLYEKALEIRRHLLGENHRDTALGYKTLAANLYGQGKYGEAKDHLLRAVDSFNKARLRIAFTGLERAGAKESPRPMLAAIHARLGQPAEAWQTLEEDLGRGSLEELAARQDRGLAPGDGPNSEN